MTSPKNQIYIYIYHVYIYKRHRDTQTSEAKTSSVSFKETAKHKCNTDNNGAPSPFFLLKWENPTAAFGERKELWHVQKITAFGKWNKFRSRKEK